MLVACWACGFSAESTFAAPSGAFSDDLGSSPLAALASTYVVNSTASTADATVGNGVCETATGNGVCTLRAAVQESNASVGTLDSIHFNIPGAPPHSINDNFGPAGMPISDAVEVDATTEPDFTGSPVVELFRNGSPAGTGMYMTGGASTVRGIAIHGFSDGITLTGGDGNTIEGNWIGLTLAGTAPATGPTNRGVAIASDSDGNLIGGGTPAARNVISHNTTGVSVAGQTNTVSGNYIGTNTTGTAAVGYAGTGVLINGAGNTVGGDTGTTPGGSCTGVCNLLSNGRGILANTANNTIEGNFIGVNVTGTASIGAHSYGIDLVGSNNTVGGTTPAARNVISGADASECCEPPLVDVSGADNVVQGNFIGTDTTGTVDITPFVTMDGSVPFGVMTNGLRARIGGATGTTPGGPCTGACNVIAGAGRGMRIWGGSPVVQGNHIGVNASGTGALPNHVYGVHVMPPAAPSAATIGGPNPGEGNVIAHNGTQPEGGDGIFIEPNGDNTTIRGNRIYSNRALGIDHNPDGRTLNDTGDPDVCCQNFPIVSSASISSTGISVAGTLNSNANQTFTLDFYGNEVCDPSGFGEGEAYLGSTSVTTDGSGNASFSQDLPAAGTASSFITATATHPSGATSEFSPCREVLYPRPASATPLRVPLVLAYDECQSPNTTHVGPLNYPSCAPPNRTSDVLTTSAVGRQGASATYQDILGNPVTPADEADLVIELNATDVKNASGGTDYTGQVILRAVLRITDRANGPSGTANATVQDAPVSFPATCVATSNPNAGSMCGVSTTADTLVPGFVKEGKLAVLSFRSIAVLDAGADGSIAPPSGTCPPTCGSGDEETYLHEGLFTP